MKKLTNGRWTPSDGNTSHGPLGNLITHLEVIALFSSNFKNVNTYSSFISKTIRDRC
jgi:hypothetical protein